MKAVLVDETNEKMFVSALSSRILKSSDILIGAVDEESDTACGIMAVSATEEKAFIIRYIYVEDSFRGRGAGRVMLELLEEFATECDLSVIMCPVYCDEDGKMVAELLMSFGFIAEMDFALYAYTINLSSVRAIAKSSKMLRVIALRKLNDDKVAELKSKWTASVGATVNTVHIADADDELSAVAYDEEDNLCGVILVSNEEESLVVDEIDVFDDHIIPADKIKNSLLAHFSARAMRDYPDRTYVRVDVLNNDRKEFLKKIHDVVRLDGAYVLFSYECE